MSLGFGLCFGGGSCTISLLTLSFEARRLLTFKFKEFGCLSFSFFQSFGLNSFILYSLEFLLLQTLIFKSLLFGAFGFLITYKLSLPQNGLLFVSNGGTSLFGLGGEAERDSDLLRGH